MGNSALMKYHTRDFWTLFIVLLAAFTGTPTASAMPQDHKDRTSGAPGTSDSCDLRPSLEAYGITARVQEKRGTCSVFALTQAIEFALAKEKGPGPRLSVEFLNWASNSATGDTEDGGFFSDLWRGFEAYGICTEDKMPYRTSYDAKAVPDSAARSDAARRREAGLRLHWIKKWDPKRGVNKGELRRIRNTLASGWPVSGGFLWPKKQVWKLRRGNLSHSSTPAIPARTRRPSSSWPRT